MALNWEKAGVLAAPAPKEKGEVLDAVVVAAVPNVKVLAAASPELLAPNAKGVLFAVAGGVLAAPKLNGWGAAGAASCFRTGVPNLNGAPENNEAVVVAVESGAEAVACCGCWSCAPNLKTEPLPEEAAVVLLALKENPACVVAAVLLAVETPAPNVKPPLAG